MGTLFPGTTMHGLARQAHAAFAEGRACAPQSLRRRIRAGSRSAVGPSAFASRPGPMNIDPGGIGRHGRIARSCSQCRCCGAWFGVVAASYGAAGGAVCSFSPTRRSPGRRSASPFSCSASGHRGPPALFPFRAWLFASWAGFAHTDDGGRGSGCHARIGGRWFAPVAFASTAAFTAIVIVELLR